MISLYEYIAFDRNQRAAALWEHGTFLTNVVLDEVGYSLYSFHGYYVEVTLLEDEIYDITPFKEGERFDKYLHAIDISELK